jgi:hypothetical protein
MEGDHLLSLTLQLLSLLPQGAGLLLLPPLGLTGLQLLWLEGVGHLPGEDRGVFVQPHQASQQAGSVRAELPLGALEWQEGNDAVVSAMLCDTAHQSLVHLVQAQATVEACCEQQDGEARVIDGILQAAQLTAPGHLEVLAKGGPVRHPEGLQPVPHTQGHVLISPGVEDHKVVELLPWCLCLEG